MRERLNFLQRDFAHGQWLGTGLDDDACPPGYALFIQGFRLAPDSPRLESLPGTQRAHAAAFASAATDIHAVQWADGTVHILAPLSTGTNVQVATDATVPLTFGQIAGAQCGTPEGWALLNNVLYISDGGLLNKYTSAGVWTNDIAGTPATTRGIVTYNNRLWGFNQNNLYFSALSNGDTLGNAGAGGGVIVFPQPLTALAVVGTSLLLFTPTGVSRFTGYGASDFQVTDAPQAGLMTGIGLAHIHRQSVAVLDNVAYVKASDGHVWAISEAGSRIISRPIGGFSSSPVVLSASPVTHLLQVGSLEYSPQYDAWTTLVGIRTNLLRSTFVPTTANLLGVCEAPATTTFVRLLEQLSGQGGLDDLNSDASGGTGLNRSILLRAFTSTVEEASIRYLTAYGLWGAAGGAVPQIGVREDDGGSTVYENLPGSGGGRVITHVPTNVRGKRLQLEFRQLAANDIGTIIRINAMGAEGFIYRRRNAVGAAA